MWKPPAVIAATPRLRPLTSTGINRLLVEPLPSWPFVLSPQHLTPPALVRVQVWYSPAATWVISPSGVNVGMGVAVGVGVAVGGVPVGVGIGGPSTL